MIIDTPSIFGGWRPVEAIDLSTPSPRPAAPPAVAEAVRFADERRVHAEQQVTRLRSAAARDAEQAAAVERARAVLLAEHRARFPWL